MGGKSTGLGNISLSGILDVWAFELQKDAGVVVGGGLKWGRR